MPVDGSGKTFRGSGGCVKSLSLEPGSRAFIGRCRGLSSNRGRKLLGQRKMCQRVNDGNALIFVQ